MDLAQRVEQLERRQRRIGAAVVTALLLVGVGVAAQKTKPADAIDVKMIRLWDDKGNLRGFLGTTPKGNTTLSLSDAPGKLCLVMGVTNNANPSIELNHSDDKMRIRLAVDDEGKPHLLFYDAEGKVTRHDE